MIPYATGLILDNPNNYGVVQTETVFGFVPRNHKNFFNNSYNETEPMELLWTHGSFERPLLDAETTSRSLKVIPKVIPKKTKSSKEKSSKKISKKSSREKAKKTSKKIKRQSKGVKKCIFKIFKKGDGEKSKRKGNRQKIKMGMGGKKYMMPIILGLLAAKSLLIPVVLKFLAFISAKGLAMGFFSTVMASVLSLKNVFDHHHYQSRKDDSKTQVEIIQIPSKKEEHFYDDFRRGDFVPYLPQHRYDFEVENNRIQ